MSLTALGGARSSEMLYANPSPSTECRHRVWRWVFLCSQTALYTLLALALLRMHRGHTAIQGADLSFRIVLAGLLGLTGLLFCVCPFFFRRVGAMAVAAWISSLVALAIMFIPIP